jgi:hypothetical protein
MRTIVWRLSWCPCPAINEWIPSWIARGSDGKWKTTKGQPPSNEDLFRALHALCVSRQHPVTWVCAPVLFHGRTHGMVGEVALTHGMAGGLLQTYVAGHSGDHGNDEADRLAKEGAQQPPCGGV